MRTQWDQENEQRDRALEQDSIKTPALRAELARLTARLAEVEREREENNDALKQWIADYRTLEANYTADLTALRSLVAKKDEALRAIKANAEAAYAHRVSAPALITEVNEALALTSADCAGKVLVEEKELVGLKRDRERVDWLDATFNSQKWDDFMETSIVAGTPFRSAIDAARTPAP